MDEAIGAAFGCGLFGLCIFGHLYADYPLARIGQNSGAGYCTRVLGFDTLRGEFSLLATAGIFGPGIVLLISSLSGVALGAALVGLLAALLWYLTAMHASHPGGPRAHRILREPQWEDRAWQLDAGWRCEVAEASHEATHAELPQCPTLTGEAAGRQTWHRATGAAGGAKPPSFNPSVNPNPEDEVWRAQRVAAWKAAGRSVPDASWKPATALDSLKKALSWYEILQSDDGHWAGDYGGPHFLLPGLVAVRATHGARSSPCACNQHAISAISVLSTIRATHGADSSPCIHAMHMPYT